MNRNQFQNLFFQFLVGFRRIFEVVVCEVVLKAGRGVIIVLLKRVKVVLFFLFFVFDREVVLEIFGF